MRDTSLSAYRSLDLTEGQRRVMRVFHRYPQETFTRAEVAQRGQLPLQSVCGRCHELIEAGYLQELKARPCKVTGNSSHPMRASLPKAAAAGHSLPESASSGRPAAAPPQQPRIEKGVFLQANERLVETGIDHTGTHCAVIGRR